MSASSVSQLEHEKVHFQKTVPVSFCSVCPTSWTHQTHIGSSLRLSSSLIRFNRSIIALYSSGMCFSLLEPRNFELLLRRILSLYLTSCSVVYWSGFVPSSLTFSVEDSKAFRDFGGVDSKIHDQSRLMTCFLPLALQT
ncbi:hypothetical protein BD410DRAFT_486194 [Rickenella mellea]|uniref:Uncharacterized protein n=1 Tax=Rickenella mellea TaxID=50990 RepID=A0A4Y7QHJ5_9AGAM|nr:hypothetical protein BD410DRAFT_486194 [Rickenella mellea]